MPVTINGTSGVTTPSIDAAAGNADLTTLSVAGNEISAVNGNWRNRIINGGMVIDQRNAGASVTINDASAYTLDRWYSDDVSGGSWTIQQSSVAPAGFTNSLLVTITAADSSLSATERCRLIQFVEGFNMSDLAWGTASASPATLSFWVRSSVTGTLSGSLLNSAENRSYPFTYTVNAANTWEQKTVTIPGETSGTWVTNNGIGIRVVWSLGMGSNFNGTAGAWNSATNFAATGATNLIATNGATFYITGVQLEAGSVATPFERRDYGRELMMCQRYYQKLGLASDAAIGAGLATANNIGLACIRYMVTMRAAPTAGFLSLGFTDNANYTGIVSSINGFSSGVDGGRLFVNTNAVMTSLRAGTLNSQSSSGYLDLTAEL